MNETILVVDDEPKITDFIKRGLAYEGFRVLLAHDGVTGLEQALSEQPDVVILDIMLPEMDGLQVCRRLRQESDVPILMLTARDTVTDRVTGLDMGADDYLTKPFALEELLARVRALLRRQGKDTSQPLSYADLTMDPKTHRVHRGDREVKLSNKEYDLLELFLRHPTQVLTRDTIYEEIWGYDFGGESNIIEVYVRYLRTKLEANGEPRLIQTVRGVGYALRQEP